MLSLVLGSFSRTQLFLPSFMFKVYWMSLKFVLGQGSVPLPVTLGVNMVQGRCVGGFTTISRVAGGLIICQLFRIDLVVCMHWYCGVLVDLVIHK